MSRFTIWTREEGHPGANLIIGARVFRENLRLETPGRDLSVLGILISLRLLLLTGEWRGRPRPRPRPASSPRSCRPSIHSLSG